MASKTILCNLTWKYRTRLTEVSNLQSKLSYRRPPNSLTIASRASAAISNPKSTWSRQSLFVKTSNWWKRYRKSKHARMICISKTSKSMSPWKSSEHMPKRNGLKMAANVIKIGNIFRECSKMRLVLVTCYHFSVSHSLYKAYGGQARREVTKRINNMIMSWSLTRVANRPKFKLKMPD